LESEPPAPVHGTARVFALDARGGVDWVVGVRAVVLFFLCVVFCGCAGDRNHRLVISAADQQMAVLRKGMVIALYPVSTSKYGLGDIPGSCATPVGDMRVKHKIGTGAPPGAVFKSRRLTGEILPVRTLVTNTVMAAHTPTLRVTAAKGLRLVPSASNWSCARSGQTVTCTRRAPLGPEEADLVVWRVRANESARAGTVDLRAAVGPGPRSVQRAPITIGSFGDPIVGITIDDRQGKRWRSWEDGSTREIAVDQVSPYRATLTNVGGGVLRRGQRVAITQTIGEGIADVLVDTPTASCTVTEDLLRCVIRATRDVAPGEQMIEAWSGRARQRYLIEVQEGTGAKQRPYYVTLQ